LPQALQKWTARMVPHDQQVAVASPGMIREELVLDSIAINAYRERSLFAWASEARTAASQKDIAGVGARAIPSARERSPATARLR
jgi:hypothetical protein